MEQNRKLNITDGWETFVNANADQRGFARAALESLERERKQRKLWLNTCGIATLGITFVILGVTGAVADWLATTVAVSSIAGGCFAFGRYWEVKKG